MPLPDVFMALKVFPIFFTKRLNSFFQNPNDQSIALVYIDDILLLAHTKTHMLDLIEQSHQICHSNKLEFAPKNHFIFFSLSNFLDMKLATTRLSPSLLKLMAYTI